MTSYSFDHVWTSNIVFPTTLGRLILVSDNNNISQLLRDSFSVSQQQQPPIWEPLLPIIPCYTPWTLSLSLSGGVVGSALRAALAHLCEVDNCRVNLDLCCFLINAVFWGVFSSSFCPQVYVLWQITSLPYWVWSG